MRSFTLLLVLLGVFSFLTAQFSFWAAFGLLYSGILLVVVMIAFSARRRQLGYTSVRDGADGAVEPSFTQENLEVS